MRRGLVDRARGGDREAFAALAAESIGKMFNIAQLMLRDHDRAEDAAELYDPATGKFTSAGSMHAGRQGHTATRLLDGRTLIAGGYENTGQGWQYLSSVELFDPTTDAFTPIGSMGDARDAHTATPLLDGRVLIAGGSYADNSGGVNLTSAVLYQP